MTPAERMAAALFDSFYGGSSGLDDLALGVALDQARIALDALCPQGERIVLDRTGDTDRLIRQERFSISEHRRSEPFTLWVDSPEGGE